ncbi:hypothetical protein DL95DRAFT_397352 [Leptodontidium sp. 2 PMI_412]|nr:hypothetical protein DL95DRAFT_397352 [Leptodontidium sp. 2 PMI_412]
MGSTMKEAFDRASGVAEEFAREHPVLVGVMVTLVALGILALVMPWVIEALGFGALGPVEGMFGSLLLIWGMGICVTGILLIYVSGRIVRSVMAGHFPGCYCWIVVCVLPETRHGLGKERCCLVEVVIRGAKRPACFGWNCRMR